MKRILLVIGGLLVVLIAAVAGLALLFDANQFRPLLEAELTKALGREVKVGDLKLALLAGSVTASELSVADDPRFSKTPFLRARTLKVGVELQPLIFSRKVNVTGLTVDQPEIDLIESAPGVWNYASLGSQTAPASTSSSAAGGKLDLSVKNVKINDGLVMIARPKEFGKPLRFEKVNLELREFSPATAIPFVFSATSSGASIKLDGKAGPIPEKDVSLTPLEANLSLTNLSLTSSGIVDKSTGVDGIAAIEGSMSTDGRKVDVKGRIKAEKLKLAKEGTPAKRLVEFDFTARHDMLKRTGTLSRGEVHIGQAVASLTGSYALREGPAALDMKLNGQKMAISELEEMLQPLGIVLPSGSSLRGGTAHAKLAIDGPADQLVISGPLGLSDTKLAGFDLGSKLKTVASLAGIQISPDTDIQTLSADVRSGPGGTEVQDLLFIAPTIGELSGAGAISPKHDLDFKMRMKLHTSGTVMAALGQKGDAAVPFFVRGTSANPSFVPDVKSIATEKVNQILKSEKVGNLLEGSEAGKAAKGILDGFLKKK